MKARFSVHFSLRDLQQMRKQTENSLKEHL